MTEYLMHYTDFNGLKGILDNNYLRMTDAFRSNDNSELRLGFEYGRQYIEKSVTGGCISTFLNGNMDMLENKPYAAHPNNSDSKFCHFITSFCNLDNNQKNKFIFGNGLLSQWRGYGSNQGYCLIFNKSKINETIEDTVHRKFKVIYPLDYNEFKKGIEEKEDFLNAINSIQAVNEKELRKNTHKYLENINIATNYLALYAIKIKHYGFHEEQEFRILYSVNLNERKEPHPKINYYNDHNNIIKRYIKFGEGKILDAIDSIMVGPSKNKKQNTEMISDYIKHNLGREIKVFSSGIPYI